MFLKFFGRKFRGFTSGCGPGSPTMLLTVAKIKRLVSQLTPWSYAAVLLGRAAVPSLELHLRSETYKHFN